MSETTDFTIGSKVVCSDGACGELRRVVVNPVTRTLTHLVVEPRFQQGTGRLVPIDLVESAGHEVRLHCSMSEFHALEEAEEQHLLIRRFAEILVPGGRLLFTSTAKPHVWTDAMTGLESVSLGAEEYRKLLGVAGISVAAEYEDVGESHYFDAFMGNKIIAPLKP